MQTSDDKPISAQELQILKNARQQFVDIRSDFLKRVSESEDEKVSKLRESSVLLSGDKSFDVLFERVLSEIAYSDGPINAREANVLNVLLGKETSKDYYNALFRRPENRNIDPTQPFTALIDLAIQLHGIEQGTAYDDKTDPVVGCFESLGHAILAADGEVNQLELDRFSKYTTIAHSRAARLYQRIKSIADGLTDNIEPQKEVPKLVKAADKISPNGKAERQVNGPDQAPDVVQKCIAELHALVGLASVKGEVETLTNLAKVFSIRKQRGLPVPDLSFHMVFSGNPGT
jgi:uncharacterized tellurite resistance protein B-like protein